MALRSSKRGSTCFGQSEPSSASTAATTAAFSSAESSATEAVTPSWFSTNLAVEASTPSAPVTLAANASRAAESTTAPPAAPPALGIATATPLSEATFCTAASISALAAAALEAASVLSEARSPPRELAPSRVSSTRAATTWEAQPSPSCQVSVTRLVIWPSFTPAAPNRPRTRSRTMSDSTGPNAL